MGWFTGLVLYVLIWWVLLFAVLPFGVRNTGAPDPHTGWRGAPEHPYLLRKILATTVIAAVIWGGCVAVIESDWLSFRHGILALPQDEP
jgi:predicted secreted protein